MTNRGKINTCQNMSIEFPDEFRQMHVFTCTRDQLSSLRALSTSSKTKIKMDRITTKVLLYYSTSFDSTGEAFSSWTSLSVRKQSPGSIQIVMERPVQRRCTKSSKGKTMRCIKLHQVFLHLFVTCG